MLGLVNRSLLIPYLSLILLPFYFLFIYIYIYIFFFWGGGGVVLLACMFVFT